MVKPTESNSSQSDKLKPIRAMRDVMDSIPEARFGEGEAKRLRKSVLLAIAMSADPDGSNAYPSLGKIASRCLCTEKAVRNVINWWIREKILHVAYKASPLGTNRYTIDLKKALRKPRKSRVKQTDVEASVPGTDVEASVPGDLERNEDIPGTKKDRPGTKTLVPGTLSTANRPLDRPYEPPSLNRQPAQPERAVGWLAGRITEILFLKTGKTFVPTNEEIVGLSELQTKHGDLHVLLGFYQFANRAKGLYGLAVPINKFLKDEAETCIAHACQTAAKFEMHAMYPETVQKIGGEFNRDLTNGEIRKLCHLGFEHSDLADDDTDNGFSIATVRNYFENHPSEFAPQRKEAVAVQKLA
jgi:hypothetical protein